MRSPITSSSISLTVVWLCAVLHACGSDQRPVERTSSSTERTQLTPNTLQNTGAAPAARAEVALTKAPPAAAPQEPPVDLGGERLVVAGMAIATPRGFSGFPCDEPCVLVLRSNTVSGGILPFAKLEVMLDVPGSLSELRANGARTYSANGTVAVEQTSTRMGADEAFDLAYDVRGTPFRQVARHAKRGRAFYVLTISGPTAARDSAVWRTLRAIQDDARIVGPEPSERDLQALYRTEAQRRRDAERTEQLRVRAPSDVQRVNAPPQAPAPPAAAPRSGSRQRPRRSTP